MALLLKPASPTQSNTRLARPFQRDTEKGINVPLFPGGEKTPPGCCFLAGGALECNRAHHRSVAALCMVFTIKSSPMHRLRGALPLLYVPEYVTRGALVAHMHSFAPPSCRTSQAVEPLCLSHCLSGTISVTLYLMVWDWRVLRAEPMLSCWPNLLFLFVSNYFLFFFLPWVDCVGSWSPD